MDNTFQKAIHVKVDKVANLVHLSVRASEYQANVFKISLGDMADMFSQFSQQMNTKEPFNGVITNVVDEDENNENNDNN